MSKLRPETENLPSKVPSLDYMANKVPVDLRGLVAVAESPRWFARRGAYLACMEVF